MKSRSIQFIVLLGGLVIASIIAIQAYWVIHSYNIKEDQFHQTATIALRNVAEAIAQYNEIELPKKSLISRKYSNYYSVNINSAIDANILEDYLFREFERRSMNTAFEYAVYDCSTDDLVYGNFCSIQDDSNSFKRSDNLPQFEDLVYYFVVHFPEKNSYLLNTMTMSIWFSIIALLSILFFIYAIWYLLRQRQLSKLQKDFINNMTHEFKTPISSIKIASDFLSKNKDIKASNRLSNYTKIIKEQNEKLNAQVEKVLNVVRMEQNQFHLVKEIFNINQEIQQIIDNEKIRFEAVKGQLNIKTDNKLRNVNGDKLHFNNIISNILDNALKYCSSAPIVNINVSSKGNSTLLSIKDNGIGISKDQQKKIFEKFYRVSTGDIHDVKGFGLGLFYVKNICDSHGWELNLKSELNQGTLITIKLATIKDE